MLLLTLVVKITVTFKTDLSQLINSHCGTLINSLCSLRIRQYKVDANSTITISLYTPQLQEFVVRNYCVCVCVCVCEHVRVHALFVLYSNKSLILWHVYY